MTSTPQPRRSIETLELVSKLDLGDDKASIGAGEHVQLPDMLSPRHGETRLFYQPASAKRQQRLRVEHRNRDTQSLGDAARRAFT